MGEGVQCEGRRFWFSRASAKKQTWCLPQDRNLGVLITSDEKSNNYFMWSKMENRHQFEVWTFKIWSTFTFNCISLKCYAGTWQLQFKYFISLFLPVSWAPWLTYLSCDTQSAGDSNGVLYISARRCLSYFRSGVNWTKSLPLEKERDIYYNPHNCPWYFKKKM